MQLIHRIYAASAYRSMPARVALCAALDTENDAPFFVAAVDESMGCNRFSERIGSIDDGFERA